MRVCPMRLDLRFYLGDAFGTPPGIFRAENVLHTQKLRNVSSITHACVRAYTHARYALLENPFVKRPDANLSIETSLSLEQRPECRAMHSERSLLFFHRASNFLSAFYISVLIKSLRGCVNIVFIVANDRIKRVGRCSTLILQ